MKLQALLGSFLTGSLLIDLSRSSIDQLLFTLSIVLQSSLHVRRGIWRLFTALGTAHSVKAGATLTRHTKHGRLLLLCVGQLGKFFPRTVRSYRKILVLICRHSLLLIGA